MLLKAKADVSARTQVVLFPPSSPPSLSLSLSVPHPFPPTRLCSPTARQDGPASLFGERACRRGAGVVAARGKCKRSNGGAGGVGVLVCTCVSICSCSGEFHVFMYVHIIIYVMYEFIDTQKPAGYIKHTQIKHRSTLSLVHA